MKRLFAFLLACVLLCACSLAAAQRTGPAVVSRRPLAADNAQTGSVASVTPLTLLLGGSLRVFLASLGGHLFKIPQGALRVLSRTRGAGRAAAACLSLAAAHADAVRLKPLILLAVIHRRTRRRMPHSLQGR